jgi:hypothetical protein
MGIDFDERDRRVIVRAQEAIQKILLDLMNDHAIKIDAVNVDTRNFANMSVEIIER